MTMSAMSGNDPGQSDDGSYSTTTADWPLKFRAHKFDAYCFSTFGCKVHYYYKPPVVDDPDDVLKPSSGSLGEKYPNILSAGMGPISNFPPPAKVTWRSKDGSAHEASVDIGAIFQDQLIRHNAQREELTLNQGVPPEIILEVNDRTINVYMRATLWTKEPQIPGNRLSDQRRDLIKVYSRTY